MDRVSKLICAAALLCAGCGEDEAIRVVRVPKPSAVALRTLAVVIARPDATWFLKLSGPADAVIADEVPFRQFVQSVTCPTGNSTIEWKTPADWKPEPTGPQRFASWRTRNGLEVSVTKLGPGAGTLLDNVNRWRRQINLSAISESDLPKVTTAMTVGGVPGTWVDLHAGEKLAPSTSVPEKPVSQSTTTALILPDNLPPGWQPLPANSIRVAAFRIGEGSDSAEVTIIPLSGAAGGLTANVNRWRGEIGLPPDQTESQIQSVAKELIVEGKPAPYFDLLGPQGDKRQRTLAVIVTRGDTTWFVKMRGAADVVARQQAAFESFVRSIKLPRGGG